MKVGTRLLVLSTLWFALGAGRAGGGAPEFDLIIRGGTVIDGTGSPGRIADVAIVGGRIAQVGTLTAYRAKDEIDARGLSVAPGFINIHSHASLEGLTTAEAMLMQGVTTEITNSDGGGPIDLIQQLDSFASASPAINAGSYIGLNAIWQKVIGETDRRPSSAEIGQMRQLMVHGLQAGAWGVSAGLDYKPAYYATSEELIRVLEAARPWRTNFPNHERLTPETNLSSKAGVAETITLGTAAGLMPIVTHAKAQGREQQTGRDITAIMEKAPVFVGGDVYPYLEGLTALRALFIPGWAQEGGRPEMLKRFRDSEARLQIAREAEHLMAGRVGGPENVHVIDRNHDLAEIMRAEGVGAGEAIIRLVEKTDPRMIARFGAEEDLKTFLRHPSMAISCDCGARVEKPSHPRSTGTFPRILGRYVREQGILTWEEAVRKMSALPANMIGLVDRGVIAAGMAADVTIFDADAIVDRSSYQEPALAPEGVKYVLVNGAFAVKDGGPTGVRAGRVLRRGVNMPSRPMSTALHRRIIASASFPEYEGVAPGPVTLRLDVSQRPGSSPRGTLRLTDSRGNSLVRGTTFGLLQTSSNWAGLTAHLIMNDGTSRPFLVTIDKADPFRNGAATVTLKVGDLAPRTASSHRKSMILIQSKPAS